MIQKLGVGAIYYNAKSEILRRVKERKGKVTIIESIPPPPFSGSLKLHLKSSSVAVTVIQKRWAGGVGATYYNAKSYILRH